jgi:hypothetical protein
MSQVSISKPEYSMEHGWYVASASISVNGKTHQLTFRSSEGPLARGSDPFLAATLFPAMRIGQPLHISGTVSPKLLVTTHTIQDIFHRWFPEYGKIPVHAEPGLSDEVSGVTEVGAFFSGGVNSFYTLLKHQGEITKIIFVHGLDIELNNVSLRSMVSKEIRRIAEELGKQLIEVETNVHEFAHQYHYNGSLLPSIGLILSAQFEKIYIPSNISYDHAFPDSSHPLLDPLWSTESLTFGHDGCEANRNEKFGRISQSAIALRSLRVCLQNPDDSYNCCQCEKCVRTMIGLEAIGALDRCPTFNQKLDIEAVSRMNLRDPLLPFAEENLKTLETRGNNADLVEALRFCIRNFRYKKMANLLHSNFGEFLASEHGTKFLEGKRNTVFRALWRNEREWMSREALKEIIKKLDQRFLFGLFRRLYDAV